MFIVRVINLSIMGLGGDSVRGNTDTKPFVVLVHIHPFNTELL